MSPEILLSVAFVGAALTYILGRISSSLRDVFSVLLSVALVAMVALMYGMSGEEEFYMGFLGLHLVLRYNMLSWLFAIAVSSICALSTVFSLSYMRGKERLNFFYFSMFLVEAGMLGVVLSGDLVSFYISWEVMSWATFLLISYNRGPALSAGMKYILMSIAGSAAYLVGMFSLHSWYGTFDISQLAAHLSAAPHGRALLVLVLFGVTFAIKNALMPLHTWLPDAHSEAPTPFSAVLSGVLIKMGTYGFVLVMYTVVGMKILLGIGHGLLSFHMILSILAGITIIFPTFVAILQDDAKRLLAWSSVAQVGYIILGIAVGTGLGFLGGVFHFFNHAMFKALLFMVVGAVEYRTKVRDLNSLGGLLKRMPFTFAAAVVGVCGLIGVPLTNGFVSKWLLYKTLILEGHPFLAFVALFGTWGTVLYSYKFIHNIFLGQLPGEYRDVEDAPVEMKLSTGLLSVGIILFGVLPGIPLRVVDLIARSVGFGPTEANIWGIVSETGTLNTINIFAAVLVASIIVWIVFRTGVKSVPVPQEDNYAAGLYVPKDRYHYSVDFYAPLYRMVGPYVRDVIDTFYSSLAKGVQGLCGGIRKLYTGDLGYYVAYIVFFVALLMALKLGFKVW